jgi:iron complex transport system ATP-binding protein
MAVTLECQNLGFDYGDKTILKGICFQVASGSFLAVLGRNGCGKTTLIHCLNRILTPVSGRVRVNGRDVRGLAQNDIARQISLVPQEHIDIFPYRVIDVVVMGRAPFLKMSASPEPRDYEMAEAALRELNALDLAQKNFNRISGGERQIALLARALAQGSPIMLLDEPTNHLDFNNQYHLLSAISHLCRSRGMSIIASMHDPNLATLFADVIVMIKNNTIMVQGETNSVMTGENISCLYDTDTREILVDGGKKMFLPTHMFKGRH